MQRGKQGSGWSGASDWSPYGRRERLWPKILLVAVILVVVLGGSVFVAGALSDDDEPNEPAGVVADDTPTEGESPTATAENDADDESEGDATESSESAPSPAVDQTPTPEPSITPTPQDPDALNTAKDIAEAYAEIWSTGAYDQLYELLSEEAKGRTSKEDFINRYEAIAVEAGIVELKAEIVSGEDNDLIFPMTVDINSSRIGEFTEDNQIPIVKQGEEYKVDWSPSLIFAGLGDGYVEWTSDVPLRGRILDRKGRPLAESGFISRVGVIPGQMTDEGQLLQKLSELLDMSQEDIKARYQSGEPNWFMPVKDYPDQMDAGLVDQLSQIPGVAVQKWPARVYPAGPAAAHITGYLSEITAEELPELAKRGYEPGDMIGRSGIEAYAEEWLAGKRGGTLSLMNRDGSLIRVIGEVETEQAKDVVLTIDLDLQRAALESLEGKVGSAVVIDPHNGQILAMASSPSYDPNKFVIGLSDQDWAELNDPSKRPLVNRATAQVYPTGSTFKVVTAAAGIVHLGYNADTWFNCPGTYSIEGQTWADWVPGGQGEMNLHRAIYRSCNTVFYKIGEELDKKGEMLLPDMARAFGFGQPSGLEALYDVPGTVPDPNWKMETLGEYWSRGDAVNLAIGQGYFNATPLQVAKAYAAITNGGTLWKPYLVMDVVDIDGNVVYSGEPEEMGKLPLNADQLKILTDGMYDVIHASDGTAVEAFQGAPYEASGKTGTAETGVEGEEDHGWFGSFAPSDNPRVTIVTMVEHGVAGSQSAAPVAREIFDKYFELYPG